MLSHGRCPVGLAFILLLAGQEVALVSAVREESELQMLAEDLAKDDARTMLNASEVPEGDEDCKAVGIYGFRKCEPEEFCESGRIYGCRVRLPYWKDDRLAAKFGSHSGTFLERSEAYRGSANSATALVRLYGLKDDASAMGECELALESIRPDNKEKAKECKKNFKEMKIKDYYLHLSNLVADGVQELQLFDTSNFEASVRENMTPFDRIMSNIDVGSKKHTVLSMLFDRVDIKCVLSLLSSGKEITTAATVEKCFPTASEEILDKTIKDTLDKNKLIEQGCKGEADEKACINEGMAKDKERGFEELEEETLNSERLLLQRLESHGHLVPIKKEESKPAAAASLLEFLDGHLDKLAQSEEEADKLVLQEVKEWMLKVAAVILIVLFAAACLASVVCAVIAAIVAAIYVYCEHTEHGKRFNCKRRAQNELEELERKR